jgi:hypothetical protein
VFSYSPSLAAIRHDGDFAVNNIIVGTAGEGYLRKIVSVDAMAESITLNTAQASLEDVYQQGEIDFTTGFANSAISGANFSYTFNNTTLFRDANAEVSVTEGSVAVNPDWNYSIQYQNGRLNSYSSICQGGTINTRCKLNVTATAATSFLITDTIKTISGSTTLMTGNVPVVITTKLYLIAHVSGTTSGPVNQLINLNNNTSFSNGTSYSAGIWHNNIEGTPTSSLSGSNITSGSEQIQCTLVPRMEVKIFGVPASTVSFPYHLNMNGNVSATTTNWDFNATMRLEPLFSENGFILSSSLSNFGNTWQADSIFYATPDKIVKVSGDMQNGTIGQYLPQPIVVKVTDNNGNAQPGVTVGFRSITGGGAFSYSSLVTDATGYARGYWQLGTVPGNQTAEVTVKKADGSNVSGSPIIFTAY